MQKHNSFSALPRRGALKTLGLAAASLGLLGACSPLGALNRFSPGEGGRLAASGLIYGPDPRQKLDVYAPPGNPKNAPVLVFFYGGGWEWGVREEYAFVGRAFAAKGFVTVVPDYRLVPQVRFPTFVDDGAAAVAWVRANVAAHGGDPAKIAVAGHSAGAYIALMIALDAQRLEQAGAPRDTVKAAVGLAGPYDFLPLDDRLTIAAFGAAENPAETQPVNFARADAPPVLLLHGDADTTVFPRNSENLAAALRRAGAAHVETIIYPGAGHVGVLLDLSRWFRGRVPVLADSIGFLDRVFVR
jgi:acetyl esterase/lipase